jgi:mannonate dehydratase
MHQWNKAPDGRLDRGLRDDAWNHLVGTDPPLRRQARSSSQERAVFIGEQIINPTPDRLRLSTQFGCEHVVIDMRPNDEVIGPDGSWDASRVAAQRRWIEGFGLSLHALALDVGSFLLDRIYDPDKARATAVRLRRDIQAAADGGVSMLKYNVQMVGITRTGLTLGRGGVQCSAFRIADYSY